MTNDELNALTEQAETLLESLPPVMVVGAGPALLDSALRRVDLLELVTQMKRLRDEARALHIALAKAPRNKGRGQGGES